MSGWEIQEADLWLENTGELLTRYSETPVSVTEYSNGTDISAEAVFVGEGMSDGSYQGVDAAGKIVLAPGDGNIVHQKAVLKRVLWAW
jgi:hypothetical protein